MKHSGACPCGSALAYAHCCEPLHLGQREAADAEALMRSRYSAFAMRRADYLWRTLHPAHPDRARPKSDVVASIRQSAETHRYLGLTVLEHTLPSEGVARVLFHAKVFHKGRDQSFIECSDFAHDGVGWRYLAGIGVAQRDLRIALAEITIANFLSHVEPT